MRLGIPGEDLPGVLDALYFIEETKTEVLAGIGIGRRVAVVGAGNTAIDAATASVRLGADEVSIVYRRGVEQMPAYHFEYEFAKQDGVIFRWLTRPVEILGTERVEGLRCVRTSPWCSRRVPVRANEPGSRVRISNAGVTRRA